MKIEVEIEGVALVCWRGVLGHREDGDFVVDDKPGEHTGPWGVVHVARGDGKTVCDRTVPGHAEELPDRRGRPMCAQCMSRGQR